MLQDDEDGGDIPELEDTDSDEMEDEIQLQVVDKKDGEGEEKGKEAVREGGEGANAAAAAGNDGLEQQLQDAMANWMPIPGMGAGGTISPSLYLSLLCSLCTNYFFRTPHASGI